MHTKSASFLLEIGIRLHFVGIYIFSFHFSFKHKDKFLHFSKTYFLILQRHCQKWMQKSVSLPCLVKSVLEIYFWCQNHFHSLPCCQFCVEKWNKFVVIMSGLQFYEALEDLDFSRNQISKLQDHVFSRQVIFISFL